jgi:hypothetical protein
MQSLEQQLLSSDVISPYYMLHTILRKAYKDFFVEDDDIDVILYTKRFIKWISQTEKRVRKADIIFAEATRGISQQQISSNSHLHQDNLSASNESQSSMKNSGTSRTTVESQFSQESSTTVPHNSTQDFNTISLDAQQLHLFNLQQQQRQTLEKEQTMDHEDSSRRFPFSNAADSGRVSPGNTVATMGTTFDSDVKSAEVKKQELLDAQYIQALDQDMNSFFTQVRYSGLIPKLIPTLQLARSTEEQRPLEQFVWYCWSKHSSKLIQEYMLATKSFIDQKRFQEAHVILSEVNFSDL